MSAQIENIKNPLLREFAEKTQHMSKGDFGMTIYGGVDLEAYAELIVQECLEACDRANEIRHFVPPTQQQVVLSCMDEIERTFGIKE